VFARNAFGRDGRYRDGMVPTHLRPAGDADGPGLLPPPPSPETLGAPVIGIVTDIDDTLTSEGRLDEAAHAALLALQAAGVSVIAVTGRPVGWCRERLHGDRPWPLAAAVAENGAVGLVPAPGASAPTLLYRTDAATRERDARRLQAVLAGIERDIPGARRATDSAGRETDIAIDHAEHARLDAATVERVVARMRAEGLTATVSSIHVNGWLGAHDKADGARWIARTLWGRDLDAERDRWLCIGDSPNDEALFAWLPERSVGVANLAPAWPRLRHRPRWVTRAERGAGFAELAEVVLQAIGRR
jgi:hypothetical protein